jgi:group I intron endonuclease
MVGYVYITTNLVNNKQYVGQHKKSTFNPYYFGSGRLINYALKKYGKENFEVLPVAFYETLEDLNKGETYFIGHFKSHKYLGGYNMSTIANGTIQTDESKKKVSESLKKYYAENGSSFVGFKFSEESKKKMSESAKGRKWTESQHVKMDGKEPWNKGRLCTDEEKEKMSIAQQNSVKPRKPFSDETRARMSEASKKREVLKKERGYVVSQETRDKLSNSLKGKKRSIVTKMNMQVAQRKYFETNPGHATGRVVSEESKRKSSESNKKYWQEKMLNPEFSKLHKERAGKKPNGFESWSKGVNLTDGHKEELSSLKRFNRRK